MVNDGNEFGSSLRARQKVMSVKLTHMFPHSMSSLFSHNARCVCLRNIRESISFWPHRDRTAYALPAVANVVANA